MGARAIMNEEFKKARDEACIILEGCNEEGESYYIVDNEDLFSSWVEEGSEYFQSGFKAGADWAYEWLAPSIKAQDVFNENCNQKLEALTKEADALANALADLENSWVGSPTCGALWQFTELHEVLTEAKRVLCSYRKFRGEG